MVEKGLKEAKPDDAKDRASKIAMAFEFDDDGIEPVIEKESAKQERSTSTQKGE